MISSNPKDCVVRRKIESVKFGFYNDAQVRDRSVVEITSPQAFDPNNTPLPSGLYDPRLGATPKHAPYCPTCALNALHCPGHFGHIELCVPCYHPILFGEIVQLLRLKCFQCHRLQAPPQLLKVYQCKFHLLLGNNLNALDQLDTEVAQAIAASRDAHNAEQQTTTNNPVALARISANAMTQVLSKYVMEERNGSATNARLYPPLTSHQRSLRTALIAEFTNACKSKKCPHCGAAAPKVRGDASNKIFVKYSRAAQRINRLEKYTLETALVGQSTTTNNTSGYESEDTVRDDEEEEDRVDSDEENESDDEDNGDHPGTQQGDNKKVPKDKYMHPGEVQAQLRRTWELDPFLCNCAFGCDDSSNLHSSHGLNKFFLQCIPVPPSRFRPPMQLGNMAVEHSQTQYLEKILQHNALIRNHFTAKDMSRAYTVWMELQTTLNCFMDSSKDPAATANTAPGIRQILERKEGLFRKNMMGKRVDYACRSVISPDPFIGTNEIGLPRYFAQVLTFPTPVTDWNAQKMRLLVERGTDVYPGARWVEMHGKRIDLTKMTRHKREAIAANLLSSLKTGMPAVVGRQLTDGDYVLMNRQPTLHKPGIMSHRVRILHNPTQKTIRMHYANCNTYNADYDGDEMNCHFPQSELARAEAIHIARTDFQYIVPTDGSPLRGLIQDHVVGGVKLTKRDTFLEKWEYQQLLFAALSSLPGLELVRFDANIEMLPPAILKPRQLWTGKQVISTLLRHLERGSDRDPDMRSDLPGLSLERTAKTPESAFGTHQDEHLVLIRNGELLRGVLDKSAFGATDFSLVHGVYEAYGPEKAGLLLNSLGRLFTAYLQYFAGHSCRMEDLVLTKGADQDRRVLVDYSLNVGARAAKAWADSEGGKMPISTVKDQPSAGDPLKAVEVASAAAKLGQLLSGTDGKHNFAALDSFMQGQLNPLASDIVKKCLPQGLEVKFPCNSFSIMTVTGAKGSIVNQSQVSCALGQQALEGRRVPRMSSGRTLPSFAPFDPNPRADGFVLDRFLTGIRPQDYYFHCMAGREGLVDTAVKTSRSGYLQRCLVKHLEELRVSYDHTVRNAEGGVVQFLYGDDGLDPTKASYLDCTDRSFEFMARNFDALIRRNAALPNSNIDQACSVALASREVNECKDFPSKGGRVVARRLRTGAEWRRGALCTGWHHATVVKVHKNDRMVDLQYDGDERIRTRVPLTVDLRNGPHSTKSLSTLAAIVKPARDDPVLCSSAEGYRIGVHGACVSERVATAAKRVLGSDRVQAVLSGIDRTSNDLSQLVAAKYSSSLCAPGEAVGCIAAQSIGEPSTQLTLNTFHLAGAGANVTLGIPRLREIIMTASRDPKTPTMSVPLRKSVTEREALRLSRRLTKLCLMELVSGDDGIEVTESLEASGGGEWMRYYHVKLKLHPSERIREAFGLSIHDVGVIVAKNFVPKLASVMKAELRRSSVDAEILGGQSADYVNEAGEIPLEDPVDQAASTAKTKEDEDDGKDGSDDDDAPMEEDGADYTKYRLRSDSASYDDDQTEDGVTEPAHGMASVKDPGEPNDAGIQSSFPDSERLSPTVNELANTITLQPLSVDPAAPPLLMVDLVEKAAGTTLLRSIKGIVQAYVNEEEGRGRCLQTAGVNFEEMWQLSNVEHNQLMSNDIWAIRCAYGVEAARKSIVDQITSVFGAYGIAVDFRHLSLIADYMTFDGGYKPLNRIGMESSSSPMLQMSFETTLNFLKKAAVFGMSDDLVSPSGNLVMGRPVNHGTGSFDLLAR